MTLAVDCAAVSVQLPASIDFSLLLPASLYYASLLLFPDNPLQALLFSDQ